MHPSLRRAGKASKFRTVMKRAERIKWLIGKNVWDENSKVWGLQKVKVVKLKTAKKEKPKEAENKGEKGAAKK